MYSRKRIGPRMDPSGTPALTGYSCEAFPSRTSMPNSKALDISSATAPVAPDLLNALSDKTVRRSAVDWEELKPY